MKPWTPILSDSTFNNQKLNTDFKGNDINLTSASKYKVSFSAFENYHGTYFPGIELLIIFLIQVRAVNIFSNTFDESCQHQFTYYPVFIFSNSNCIRFIVVSLRVKRVGVEYETFCIYNFELRRWLPVLLPLVTAVASQVDAVFAPTPLLVLLHSLLLLLPLLLLLLWLLLLLLPLLLLLLWLLLLLLPLA
jgi:hypothetical protein